ncbi:MAG: hypothetical protein HYR58_03925 [Acidobacteria bacterium]|nr:hypothetical protein [Acidobacteriota bacterium]MBI3484830.1 hypothetical protein [Acidobacteriota bacterium]
MEKKILQYSYWLGVISVVIAIVWRAVNALGYGLRPLAQGTSIYYMSFYKAALLFLLLSIATGAYSMAGKEKP